MTKNFYLALIVICVYTSVVNAQSVDGIDIPKEEIKNGVLYRYGVSIDTIVSKSDLIFEGRILTDSAFRLSPTPTVFTHHKVLVLKKFSGVFVSDTIRVATWGGKVMVNGEWDKTPGAYAFTGDEALFFITMSTKIYLGGNDSTTYEPYYGPASYITVCDKKDVVKEVYEPIEAVVGQKYIDVHPNRCKEQSKLKSK